MSHHHEKRIKIRSVHEQKLAQRYECREHFLRVPFPDGGRTETVFYQTFEAPAAAKEGKHILYVHGLNSYGGRIARFVEEKFLQRGISSVSLMDLPGFGRSSGTHAYIRDMQDMVLAVRRVVTHLREQQHQQQQQQHHNSTKVATLIAYGTSMGAHVLMRYQASGWASDSFARIDGLVLGSPLIKQVSKKMPPPFAMFLLRLLNRILPTLPLLPGRAVFFPRDPEMEQDHRSDPIIYHGYMRLGTALAFVKAIEEFPEICKNFGDIPFIALVGSNDTTICVNSIKDFYHSSMCKVKDLVVYEDCDHDIPFERHINERYFADIVSWIEKVFP